MKKLESTGQRLAILSRLMNMPGMIVTPEGQIEAEYDRAEICALCPQRRVCRDCAYCGKMSAQTGTVYIHRCTLGGVICAGTILSGGKTDCFALLGPVRMWDWDEFARSEALDMYKAVAEKTSVPDSTADILAAQEALRNMECEAVRDACHMLFDLCTSASFDDEYLADKRNAYYQQSMLFGIVANDKSSNTSADYPLRLEQELLGRVRLGDRDGAELLLNELLGHLLYGNAGNMELLKARAHELVIVMSRAAMENGASVAELLELNARYANEITQQDTTEKLCLWLTGVLTAYISRVRASHMGAGMETLRQASEYIAQNFGHEISLEDTAEKVHISAYHLSHLFSSRLGVTFSDYLTRTRIEKAKLLLTDASITIAEAAKQTGYDDPGYFSRVFKKLTGISPVKYKKDHSEG